MADNVRLSINANLLYAALPDINELYHAPLCEVNQQYKVFRLSWFALALAFGFGCLGFFGFGPRGFQV
ncbi:hypothetical protein CE91St30_12860 [Raoultibacter timonensis]|uniref:Uncharacterized protein n=1 Tax=Raoultibacter timonensis TaxID=1907662 RepID=A0ABN6MHH4_9ACTN|nr:hypothetical protein CE91St30_12860 [Raoultibacter timonensis]BDF50557.1 hypothetical protein CE91St31_12870 [Raoultibacter timonensis]